MHFSLPLIALVGVATALPRIPFVTTTEVIPTNEGRPVTLAARHRGRKGQQGGQQQGRACFVIGDKQLPAQTAKIAASLAGVITCAEDGATTLSGVPDVTSASGRYSEIDFSQSDLSPLGFALATFAPPDPLASADLALFQDALNVYLATEAGVRSVGGGLAIKIPKFFLEMQVSRIQTAQGNPPTAAGLQVDHLRDKVLESAKNDDQALLDQVKALAEQLE